MSLTGVVNYKNTATVDNDSAKYSGKPITSNTSSSGKSQSRVQKVSQNEQDVRLGKICQLFNSNTPINQT